MRDAPTIFSTTRSGAKRGVPGNETDEDRNVNTVLPAASTRETEYSYLMFGEAVVSANTLPAARRTERTPAQNPRESRRPYFRIFSQSCWTGTAGDAGFGI